MKLTVSEQSFLDHLLLEELRPAGDKPAHDLLRAWDVQADRIRGRREREVLRLYDDADSYEAGLARSAGQFQVPWENRETLLVREAQAYQAWEQSYLNTFYGRLKAKDFVTIDHVASFARRSGQLAGRELTRRQEMVTKVLATTFCGRADLAMTRGIYHRLDVLDRIAAAWNAEYGVIHGLDDWMADAVARAHAANGIAWLPGLAPTFDDVPNGLIAFHGGLEVDGWLFHAPEGVPFDTDDGAPVRAVVAWIKECEVDDPVENLDLWTAIVDGALQALAERRAVLSAALGSADAATRAVNAALRDFAWKTWPADDVEAADWLPSEEYPLI